MIKSSLRRVARPSGSVLASRSIAPSIAPFNTRAHQRRHSSSSKPPVPPNNGSPAIPTDVKQVATRSDARSEGKKPASDRLSRKKAAAAKADAAEAQDNWTSSLPSVPSLHNLSPKDLHVAAFYATYRPVSISGPGPKETLLKDVEKIFQPKTSKPKSKGTSEVIYTLSSALETLNDQIETRQTTPQEESAPAQKELFRIVEGGKHFKIEVHNPYKPFHAPPVPVALSQEQIDELDRQAANNDSSGEELLARQLETQVESQDVEAAVSRGRRDRQRLNDLLTPRAHTQTAQIVLNTSALRKHFNFFSPSAPSVVKEPEISRSTGQRRRRGFVVLNNKRQVVFHLISVKRQRKLKMKKHKYKKLMRKTRNLRRRQDKL